MPTLNDVKLFAQYHLVRRVHTYPARDAAMGVVPIGYEPEAFEREVRALADRFDVEERARVAYRGTSRPILSVRSRNRATAKKRLLVLSGVHGNEQAGILCIPDVLDRFHRAGDRYADVALHVLTPVNPVGAAELSRFNADGYDINRDFVRFATEEARVVRSAFEEAPPDFVISLHEGPQDAAFMFANRWVTHDVAIRLLGALERGGTVLAETDYFGSRLSPRGLSPSTPAGRVVLRLWAGALGMMAANEYAAGKGVPELTLESSWRSTDRAARVRAHVDLCLAVADELAADARP
ncbi:MAG: DUF2817 domain-containing protein [Sandaracinus sp.]